MNKSKPTGYWLKLIVQTVHLILSFINDSVKKTWWEFIVVMIQLSNNNDDTLVDFYTYIYVIFFSIVNSPYGS